MHARIKSSTFAPGFRYMSKRVVYMMPVEWMAGSISGPHDVKYAENKSAYSLENGLQSAVNYSPILVLKYKRSNGKRFFNVRTRSSVNMNTDTRASMAVLGGAGAIFSAVMRDKSSAIYIACYAAFVAQHDKQLTFRAFMMRPLIDGLKTKAANIQISTGISIVNPWISSDTPNVPIESSIITKFNSVLS